jgi:hypothetical protein
MGSAVDTAATQSTAVSQEAFMTIAENTVNCVTGQAMCMVDFSLSETVDFNRR